MKTDIDHLSYSQINQWLGCQSQYWYQRIEELKPMDISSSLIVGSAYHTTAEMYYNARMKNHKPVGLNEMIDVFEHILEEEDNEQRVNWGRSNLKDEVIKAEGCFKAFLEGQDESEIVAVEELFKLELDNLPPIIGRIDLIERNKAGDIIIVDLKTAATKPSSSFDPFVLGDIDASHQMTLYKMWAQNEYPDENILLRMDYLIKSKKNPSFMKVFTERTQSEMVSLENLIRSVYNQIQMAQAGVINPLPVRSFRCNGCGYRAACSMQSVAA